MKTQKNNKLIAEFMNEEIGFSDTSEPCVLGDYSWKPMKYHKSWDWLMPVVEKIEQSGYVYDFTIDYCSVFGYTVKITSELKNTFSDFTRIRRIGESTKINTVYEVVMEFINWYNKNK